MPRPKSLGVRVCLSVSTVVVVWLLVSAFAQQAAPASQAAAASQAPAGKSPFDFQEVMVPMRDGVHLQTAILTPVGQQGPLPILLRRTPYGVPDKAPEQMPANLKELPTDGYIFVIQNLRGRFKSEGRVQAVVVGRPQKIPKRTTRRPMPTIQSIGWSRIFPTTTAKWASTAFPMTGFTAALPLLHPHPALKAVSEQASPGGPVDERRRSSLRRAARKLRLRVRGNGTGRQKQEHAFRFRNLRHL